MSLITSTDLADKSDIEVEYAAYRLADWIPWWWTGGKRRRYRKNIDPYLPMWPGERVIVSAEGWASDGDRLAAAQSLCAALKSEHGLSLDYDGSKTIEANVDAFTMAAADSDES